MKTLIVPLDHSDRSETAVDPAAALAKRLGADVRLLTTVWGVDPGEPERYLSRVAAEHGIVPGAVEVVRHEFPAAGILEAAAGSPGATVCMASHGHRGFAEVLLGSVTAEVLHRSPSPVLLVGSAIDRVRPLVNNIVVCWDGSDRSRAIVPTAAVWAKALDVQVRLVHVRDRIEDHGADVPDALGAELDALVVQLAQAGVLARWHVIDRADIAEAVLSHTTRWTGLILATSHGRGGRRGLGGSALGRVVAQVVRTSTCPVLVQPAHN